MLFNNTAEPSRPGEKIRKTEKKVKFTDDQKWDELSERFNRTVQEAVRRDSTRQVLQGLLDLFQLLDVDEKGELKREAKKSAENIRRDEHIRNVLRLAQEIFESFSGNKTLDPFILHVKAIGRILRDDTEARSYFIDVKNYLAHVLKNPEVLGTPESNNNFKELARRSRKLHDEKLRGHLNGALNEIKELIARIERDPATRTLREDMKRLVADLVLDEQGNSHFENEC